MPLGSNLRGEAKKFQKIRLKNCEYLFVWKRFDFFVHCEPHKLQLNLTTEPAS